MRDVEDQARSERSRSLCHDLQMTGIGRAVEREAIRDMAARRREETANELVPHPGIARPGFMESSFQDLEGDRDGDLLADSQKMAQPPDPRCRMCRQGDARGKPDDRPGTG